MVYHGRHTEVYLCVFLESFFFSYTLSLIKFRLGSLFNDLLIGFILHEILTSKCLLVDLCFIFESYWFFLSQLCNLLIFLVLFMLGTVFHWFCWAYWLECNIWIIILSVSNKGDFTSSFPIYASIFFPNLIVSKQYCVILLILF